MVDLKRARDLKIEVYRRAGQRFADTTPVRESNMREVDRHGIGSADSAQRRIRLSVREKLFETGRQLRAAGQLPYGIERRIGPTLDWNSYSSDRGTAAGKTVARIVERFDKGAVPQGIATGFMVTDTLLITNHHVFQFEADAVGCGANFGYEEADGRLQPGVIFELDPSVFFVADEELDFAVVGVKSRSIDDKMALTHQRYTPLVEATPKILVGQTVQIIQHPEGGPKKYAEKENKLLLIDDRGFLQYETDTMPGSSGSPAFGPNWELVALHHSGVPRMENRRIMTKTGEWAPEMGDDAIDWIANEGIRVSSIVKKLGVIGSSKALPPRKQAILEGLLATTTDPTDEIARLVADKGDAVAIAQHGNSANNVFQISGPVTVHVYAPNPPPGPTPLQGATSQTIAARPGDAAGLEPPVDLATVEKALRFDLDYDNRNGYDANFLGSGASLRVPPPGVSAARTPDILQDGNGEVLILKYNHFSLVMNKKRRLVMWTAANVDYAEQKRSGRPRKAFGSESWRADSRAKNAQLQDAEFYKPAGRIDRGHLVRRDDSAWGSNEGPYGDRDTEEEYANSDTFHWTNCTPQHEAFNQQNPKSSKDPRYAGLKGLWGDFEEHLKKSLLVEPDTKACVLAGPVLDDVNDPSADFGAGDIQYPLAFWKIVVAPDGAVRGTRRGRAIKAYGFVFWQKDVVRKFGIEAFRPDEFSRHQRTLAEIEQLTGVVFDPALHAVDAARTL